MSKRAEAAALKAYPNVEQPVWDKSYPKTLFVRHTERNAFIKGYEQAEKDTIERVCEWLEKNVTFIHPRKGVPTCIVNLSALKEAILGGE